MESRSTGRASGPLTLIALVMRLLLLMGRRNNRNRNKRSSPSDIGGIQQNSRDDLTDGAPGSGSGRNDGDSDGDKKDSTPKSDKDRAAELGYTQRIPAQKADFDSHGQTVFYNPKTKTYISRDVDGHNISDGWKMFDRKGRRIGTYDSDLNYLKK